MSKTVEQLDKMGEESLIWLKDFAEKGVDFVQTQAPDLCREIVNLGLWQWGFLAIMWLCIACVTIYLAKKLIQAISSEFGKSEGGAEIVSVVVGFVGVSPLVGVIISLYNFVTIYAAPKVYLINYFANLYRQTKG